MPIQLSKEQVKDAVVSIQNFYSREMDADISELKAKFLLDYFLKEIAPIAYNKGVEDAETFFRSRLEELKSELLGRKHDLLAQKETREVTLCLGKEAFPYLTI